MGSETYYHGSSKSEKPVPEKGLSYEGGGENVFDGIFVSPNRDAASSHGGGHVHEYDIDDSGVCDTRFLMYHADYRKILDVIRKETRAKSPEDVEALADAVIHEDEPDEHLHPLLRNRIEAEWGGIGWEMQRLRGRVAAALGFDAVTMDDEHGTSYLMVAK